MSTNKIISLPCWDEGRKDFPCAPCWNFLIEYSLTFREIFCSIQEVLSNHYVIYLLTDFPFIQALSTFGKSCLTLASALTSKVLRSFWGLVFS